MSKKTLAIVRKVFAFVGTVAIVLSLLSVQPVSANSGPISNYRLTTDKIINCFDRMPTKGKEEKIKFLGVNDLLATHFQGYAKYGSTVILSRNDAGFPGRIISGTRDGLKNETIPTTEINSHPGGFQTIGNYLLTPIEVKAGTVIAMYEIINGRLYRKDFKMTINGFKAGALGITQYDSGGVSYYLMVLVSGKSYRVYRAAAQTGSGASSRYIRLEEAEFYLVGSNSTSSFPDFQGIGLVTSTDNKIYIIGPHAVNNLLSMVDYVYLMELNTKTWQVTQLRKKHVTCQGGGILRAGAVSFRYGTGVQIFSNGFEIYASERNRMSANGDIMTNYFTARF